MNLAVQNSQSRASSHDVGEELRVLAAAHPCSSHRLFDVLESVTMDLGQVASLLRNYDAHASVLRRYLLRAAAIMPEEAVPLVLENVRNEYGNGDYQRNHQGQLRDLAYKCGLQESVYMAARIEDGIKRFIKEAMRFYCPKRSYFLEHLKMPAIVAGAITATEILAVKEFAMLQKAFAHLGLAEHHWFHHVTIEEEHRDESVALAIYFTEKYSAFESVKVGLMGVLDANVHLYDGLLSSLLD